MPIKLPTFDYRQFYEVSVNTMEEVEKLFFKLPEQDTLYFRGMSKYDYICNSTYFRHYLSQYPVSKWDETEVGHGKSLPLPKIDQIHYTNYSWEIIDTFKQNLLDLGSKKLNINTIIYLAQHYELPTNLIDFTVDPKIALWFACSGSPSHDCVIYVYNIYYHVHKIVDHLSNSNHYNFTHDDGTEMSSEEIAAEVFKNGTTITRKKGSNVTPIIKFEDTKYSKRIQNQKGSFVYHGSYIPFDSLMYQSSKERFNENRRLFRISKGLKSQILQELKTKYNIDKDFIYPDIDDNNLEIINKAVKKTKDTLNI